MLIFEDGDFMAKKIMISIDEALLKDVEDYANKMHLNRSASFSVLCSTALQAQKSIDTLTELLNAYRAQNGPSMPDFDSVSFHKD